MIVSGIHVIIITRFRQNHNPMKIGHSKAATPARQRKLLKIKMRKPRKSSWNIPQQTLYLDYLKKNAHLMKSERSRRANQVFKKISMMVATRTSVQVKTHHQKLEEKYQNTSNIIYHIQLLIRKNVILEAQRLEEEAERARDQASSTNIVTEQKIVVEEEGKVDPVNSEIPEDPFFDYQSEKYEPLAWEFVIDCNQPLL